MPGSYEVTASAEGWFAEPLAFEVGSSDLIELEIPLHAQAWLGGVVRDRVTQAPVADFELEVQERRSNGQAVGMPFSPHAVQGSNGGFCIAEAPGWGEEWRLVVSSPRHDPAATDWFACESERGGLVVLLEPMGSTFATVRGRVVDHAGAPIADARLALVVADAPPSSVWVHDDELWLTGEAAMVGGDEALAGYEEGRAISGEDGSFELRTTRGGRAQLVGYAPGLALTRSDPLELALGQEVDVGSLALAGGASLSGEVVPALDPRDRVEPRDVLLESLAGSSMGVSLDGDLRFAVDGLDPGMYRVSVQAEVLQSFGGDERQVMPITSELVHLEPFESKHVVLSGGANVRGGHLRGTLSVPDQRLVTGGVALLAEDGQELRHAILQDDLSFVVLDVPPGRFTLMAVGASTSGSIVGLAYVDVEVDAGSSPERVSLVLAGPRLEMRAPAYPRAWISITGDTGSAALDRFLAAGQIRADEDGHFEFACLPAGRYEFRIDEEVRSAVVSAAAPHQVIAW